MANEKQKDSLQELGEGLKTILERIAGFFDIFDLSFIVSGVISLTAIVFWLWRINFKLPQINNWKDGIVLLIISYVFGLICFALGRWIRKGLLWHFAEKNFSLKFIEVINAHGLTNVPLFCDYLNRSEKRSDWRLYVRLWAEIRESTSLATSFSLLKRYWVMSATYDGVAIALFIWIISILACTLGFGNAKSIDIRVTIIAIVILAISVYACIREALRYENYQIEELVASIAVKQDRIINSSHK